MRSASRARRPPVSAVVRFVAKRSIQQGRDERPAFAALLARGLHRLHRDARRARRCRHVHRRDRSPRRRRRPRRWELLHNSTQFYAACHLTHASVDAGRAIRARTPLAADAIERALPGDAPLTSGPPTSAIRRRRSRRSSACASARRWRSCGATPARPSSAGEPRRSGRRQGHGARDARATTRSIRPRT